MAKKTFVTCVKCGKTDESTKTHVGTSTKMHCSDCDGTSPVDDGSVLNPQHRYLGGPATMCRNCCPTGHGTRF